MTTKTKVENTKPEQEKETKPEENKFESRNLTEEEKKMMLEGEDAPEGYMNRAPVKPSEEKEEVKESGEGKEKEPAEEKKEPVKEPAKEDFFDKLESELEKPEGKENLKEFTPREKAYFYRMRRDIKLRQKAERERDAALFNNLKMRNKEPDKKEPEPNPLEGREDDDLLTVKDVKDILKNKPPKEEVSEKPESKFEIDPMRLNFLKMCEEKSRANHPEDFDSVMELADDLVAQDSEALKEISERTRRGENPAEVMYEIIKGHQEFENLYPAAETRWKARQKNKNQEPPVKKEESKTPELAKKEEEAKAAEKALEENAAGPRTTAHVSSREGKTLEELTLDEIARMSDYEFARLPRQVRQRYLKQYGSEPARLPT